MSLIPERWQGGWRRRMAAWLQRRLPRQKSITLHRGNLFIFPTGAGLAWLLLIIIMWLTATNYQNNLVFVLAALLSSLFVTTILYTYSNLAGLTITAINGKSVFAGERAEFRVQLSRAGKRQYESIHLQWPGSEVETASLIEAHECTVKLYVPTERRGIMQPARLRLETRFPLGIMRCWTLLLLDCPALIYPQPVPAGPLPPAPAAGGDEGELQAGHGADDFYGLTAYQPGMSLRHLAWKQFARGQGLFAKEYSDRLDQRLWLDWEGLPGLHREARLSRLCHWVIELSKTRQQWGLRLPGQELPPGNSERHRDEALRMLALFEAEALG